MRLNPTALLALLALLATLAACGATPMSTFDANDPSADAMRPTDSARDGALTPGDAAPDALTPAGDSGVDSGAAPVGSMRLISRDAPAFASTGPNAAAADDSSPTSSWSPTRLPAWIAYDLSRVPAADRGAALIVWNALHEGDYIVPSPTPDSAFPVDYTLEMNAAPGGTAAPPAAGWVSLATVTANNRGAGQHLAALAGANWVRMSVTRSSDPAGGLALDLDVYAAPSGATDSWLFMGDSITHITFGYAFSDLPARVHAAAPGRWPAVINAGIGGTSTGTAVDVVDSTMAGFPGRYVVLAYGTNDGADTFAAHMQTLIEHVLAAGKIPVVPHMPWSDQRLAAGPAINAAIDALYARFPAVVHGPDLWAAFMNRTDLIPAGDVHPNNAGQDVLRAQWAAVMTAQP